jgi:gliding motility-associated-like protein
VKFCWLLFLFTACALTGLAQKQASIWYFGDYAGLDFRAGTPVPITDGALSTQEGSASICDEDGNLHFYTDGATVYNRLHQAMPNGRNLWGSFTTTQTLIVPKPGIDPIYYIFTASPQYDVIFGPGADSVGFHYTIVDMSYEGGLGDVVSKNNLLFRNTTEKVTGVHHANGKDIWVVAHEWGNNKFRSYLVTEQGLDEPVISEVGVVHEGDGTGLGSKGNSAGQMKISPTGTKLALAVSEIGVFMFDFDNHLGLVFGPIVIQQNPVVHYYGIEFSPDAKLVYFTDVFGVGCNTEIEQSLLYRYWIETRSTKMVGKYIGVLGALQLGPDGIIYGSQCNNLLNNGTRKLSAILSPNNVDDCSYMEDYLFLINSNGVNGLGLPNFIQSYFQFPDPQVEFPNVFSPNNDEYNQVLEPIVYENILSGRLRIINRWGQEVFSSDDVRSGWDGGSTPTGVYYWTVRYEGKNGMNGALHGWVHLIR